MGIDRNESMERAYCDDMSTVVKYPWVGGDTMFSRSDGEHSNTRRQCRGYIGWIFGEIPAGEWAARLAGAGALRLLPTGERVPHGEKTMATITNRSRHPPKTGRGWLGG